MDIVTCKQMEVDGLSFKEESMLPLILIETGLTIKEVGDCI